MEYALFGLHD